MHDVKKKEHENNQKHNTQDVDNGVRIGGTTSLGPGVKMVQATALNVVNSDDVHRGDVIIIQGKCPHVGLALRDVPLQELLIKRLLSV